MEAHLPAAQGVVEVHLGWKGLFLVSYVGYEMQPDDFFRKLGKAIQQLDDIDLDRRGFWFYCTAEETVEGLEVEELLFIGSAWREDLRQRIQDRRLFGAYRELLNESRNKELYLAFSNVSYLSSGVEPRRFVSDIENALVFQNQPFVNRNGRDEYYSEVGNRFRITNMGDYFPLEETCNTETLS
jgi:hypothetical protein